MLLRSFLKKGKPIGDAKEENNAPGRDWLSSGHHPLYAGRFHVLEPSAEQAIGFYIQSWTGHPGSTQLESCSEKGKNTIGHHEGGRGSGIPGTSRLCSAQYPFVRWGEKRRVETIIQICYDRCEETKHKTMKKN